MLPGKNIVSAKKMKLTNSFDPFEEEPEKILFHYAEPLC